MSPKNATWTDRARKLLVTSGTVLLVLLLIPIFVLGAISAAKMLWGFFSSPRQFLRFYWHGIVSGYDRALELASVPLPFVLEAFAWGIAAVTVAGVAALLIAVPKRRRPIVFVSYHHSMLGTVKALSARLDNDRLQVNYIPFETDPGHDALLDRIDEAIRASDFVVTFPGPKPSFVDHEVFAAGVAKKPMFIVLSRINQGSPNTAQRSYPAFVLEELEASGFRPLASLIECLHGGIRQVRAVLFRFSTPPGWLLAGLAALFVLLAVLTIGAAVAASLYASYLIAFERLEHGLEIYAARVFLIPALLFLFASFVAVASPVIYLGGLLATFSQRNFAARLAARRVRVGTYAYEQFESLTNLPELGRDVLKCLWKVPPRPYHEQEGHRSQEK